MKKQIIFTWLLFAALNGLQAQDFRHEFGAMLGGGLSGLKYSVANGESSTNFGFQGGLSYTYCINSSFGVVTGVEYGLYNSKASLSNGEFTRTHIEDDLSNDPDPANRSFDYVVSTVGYEETQSVGMLSIPILGQYQADIANDMRFYAQGGVRLGFPLSAKNKASAEEVAGVGDYPAYGGVKWPVPGQGNNQSFVIFPNYSSEQDLSLKMSYSLSVEAGINYMLSADWKIYAGLFMDYGLNSVRDAGGKTPSLLEWKANTNLTTDDVSSLMNVQDEVGEAKFLSFGLRVRIAFGTSGGGGGRGYRRR